MYIIQWRLRPDAFSKDLMQYFGSMLLWGKYPIDSFPHKFGTEREAQTYLDLIKETGRWIYREFKISNANRINRQSNSAA